MISQSLKCIFHSFKTQFSLAITWLSSALKNSFSRHTASRQIMSLCLFIRPFTKLLDYFSLPPSFIYLLADTNFSSCLFSLDLSVSFRRLSLVLAFCSTYHRSMEMCQLPTQRSSFKDLKKDQTSTRIKIHTSNSGLQQRLETKARLAYERQKDNWNQQIVVSTKSHLTHIHIFVV